MPKHVKTRVPFSVKYIREYNVEDIQRFFYGTFMPHNLIAELLRKFCNADGLRQESGLKRMYSRSTLMTNRYTIPPATTTQTVLPWQYQT